MVKKPVVDITEEDMEILRPQLEVALETLSTWPLGRPVIELAALLVLKIIAVTSGQLKERGVYDRPSRIDSFVQDPFGQL